MALTYKPTTWKIKKIFYHLQIIANRAELNLAKTFLYIKISELTCTINQIQKA